MIKLRPLAAFLAVFVFVLNSAFGAAPAIITQPVGQNVSAGAAVTLSVSASGTGTLTYQWKKNGFSILDATSATYSIASAVGTNTGGYTVVVTNNDGSTTSNVALLTVGTGITINAITINTQPISQTVNAGSSVTFHVDAGSTSTEALTYQWQKGGLNISGATGAYYTIPTAVGLNAGNYTVLVANSVAGIISTSVTLAVNLPPEITTQPVSDFANVGDNDVVFSVGATSPRPLTYQWQKGTTNIPGATSASYPLGSVAEAHTGSYRVIVTDSLGLSTTSSAVALLVGVSAPAPDGYGAAATGGSVNGTAITVSTPAAFRSAAEDAATLVITVNGVLNLGSTKVAVKSSKTIQGFDADATLIANLELASGVNNVIIRGLNITNPSGYGNGDGISIVGATNVYITHCSIYDCTDGLIDITAGADNVTVSWCDFGYENQASHRWATMVGADTGETKALRVTLHHNWWTDRVNQSMPVTTWGQIHMHSNLFTNADNTNAAATKVQASAQLLSERNRYVNILDPIVRSGTGLIRVNNNVYSGTSLTPFDSKSTNSRAEEGADTVFTPSYSYEMLPASDWVAALRSGVGNTAGAASKSPSTPSSVTATSDVMTLTAGGSFTISATLNGFSTGEDIAYQWRFKNAPLPGGDKKELAFSNAQAGEYGPYTVVVLKSSGASVVSSPVTVTVNAAASTTTPTQTTDDGGGAPSAWFFAALSLVALGRRFTRQSRETTSAQ